MKKIKKVFIVIIILINFSIISFSHSGRTDGSGGHYNRSTGEYHYHHGREAHDHPNGICPYSKKTTTVTTSSVSDNPNFKNYPHLSNSEKIINWIEENPDISLCIIIIGICLASNLIISLYEDNKKKQNNNDLQQTTYIYSTDYTTSSTQTETNKPVIKTQNNYVCPKCGGQLQIKNGKYGKFIGCKNYPNCKYTKSLKK